MVSRMSRSISSASAAGAAPGNCLRRETGGFGLPFFYPAPRKRGGGTARLRGGRGAGLDDHSATTTKRRVRRPLHHATRGPPPLAIAGADERHHSRNAFARACCRSKLSNSNKFSSSPPALIRRSMLTRGCVSQPELCFSLSVTWIAGSSPAMTKKSSLRLASGKK
jgi:hypothetical protein